MKKILYMIAFVLMLAYPAFSDSEPAHVILSNVIDISGGNDSVFIQTDDYSPKTGATATSVTVFGYGWSLNPVMSGSIPSERNALMNAGEPVDIIVRGNTLSITNWGGEGVYSIRVLDSNGSPIMKDTLRTRSKSYAEIPLTPEYRHYYIEFAETDSDYDSEHGYFPSVDSPETENRYCYVLLRAKGTKAEPQRNNPPVRQEVLPDRRNSDRREPSAASEVIDDIYRRLRNRTGNDSENKSDSVIRFEDRPAPSTPDGALRPITRIEPEPEESESQDEDEETSLIPARRIRIKRNTEYETESESPESEE